MVGFRTFMRWEFLNTDNQKVTAVRAVDTATLPTARGRGVFANLTLCAVDELISEGIGLVFNTPNAQSRPGYLKMGWSVSRRLPLSIRPRSVHTLPTLSKARVPAERWSTPTTVGVDAGSAFADRKLCSALLTHAPARGWRTNRTPEYLAWRFGLKPLHYRLMLASSSAAEGGLVFRLRKRGPALEAAIAEQFVPDRRTGTRLIKRMLRETNADYAAGLGSGTADGMLRVPTQGPLLTTRPLVIQPPPASDWSFTLGDIELF